MALGDRYTDDECAFILGAVQQSDKMGRARTLIYKELGEKFGRDWRSIGSVVQRLAPTVNLAQARIRAAAARMVRHVINKGSVAEHIDILSRPNIGVLEPIKKVDPGAGGGGFFSSITVESCGAVRTTITQGQAPEPIEEVPHEQLIDVEGSVGLLPVGGDDSGGTLPILSESPYIVLSNVTEAEHPKPVGVWAQRLEASRARLAEARSREGTQERMMDYQKLHNADGQRKRGNKYQQNRPKSASLKGPKHPRAHKKLKDSGKV